MYSYKLGYKYDSEVGIAITRQSVLPHASASQTESEKHNAQLRRNSILQRFEELQPRNVRHGETTQNREEESPCFHVAVS